MSSPSSSPSAPSPRTPLSPDSTQQQQASPPVDIVGATPGAATTPADLAAGGGTGSQQPTPFSDALGDDGSTPNTPNGSPDQPTTTVERVIWGTQINYAEAVAALDSFLTSFVLPNNNNNPPTPQPAPAAEVHTQTTPVGEPAVENPTQDESAPQPLYPQLLAELYYTGGSALNVNLAHLRTTHAPWYNALLSYPENLVPVFDQVANDLFARNHADAAEAISTRQREAIHVRCYNLHQALGMRSVDPSHISTMVAIRGMVIRASMLIPDLQKAMYRCTKCAFHKEASIQDGRIDEPRDCPSCRSRDSFALLHSRSVFADRQMMRLQEAPESVPNGETPATFTLVCYDGLVDAAKPGDRVEVTGILRASPVRVNPKMRTVKSVFRTYVDAIHITILNNNQERRGLNVVGNATGTATEHRDFMASPNNGAELPSVMPEQRRTKELFFEELACHPRVYQRLADSVAPSIFGMTDEKKGILLQLFGGASKVGVGESADHNNATGAARFRSAINVLLVGDPGTSKSQLLQSAHRLAPRGVYTSGRGSSAVGLTAYITRDPDSRDFVLESGALVLSDRGVCCIDEFDKMSDFARSVLHEAMEQQTVSIAKAGIIATLNARTAVLAAANPVNSRYDANKSVVENIDLPPTLLSRFDLIYLVLDTPNAEADRRLAQHIVSLFYKNAEAGQEEVEAEASTSVQAEEMLDAATLTEYIAFARHKVDPRISGEAADALVGAYLEMRSGGRGGATITATPRQLESLIRLAEAHARMQLKEEVEVEDVDEAVRLVRSAIRSAAFDPATGKVNMDLLTVGAGENIRRPEESVA
jgi:DNA replication licensing factor MCM4